MTIFTDMIRCYAEYRPPYPKRLIDDLRSRTVGNQGECLVDWGCGTGELTLPLSPFFERAIGIDFHPPMVAIARETARKAGVKNVEWLMERAEEVELEPESCDLITAASAFHWMDRELLSERAFQALKPGAALALVGGGGGGGVRKGQAEWHRVAAGCLEKYARRAQRQIRPQDSPSTKQHADFLIPAGFQVKRLDYHADFAWQVDEVIGYLYSISFATPQKLGDRLEDFENDLRDELSCLNPSGTFHETLDFYLTIAHKRS